MHLVWEWGRASYMHLVWEWGRANYLHLVWEWDVRQKCILKCKLTATLLTFNGLHKNSSTSFNIVLCICEVTFIDKGKLSLS